MGDNLLASIGSHRAPIIVQLSEYDNRRTVDIRRHFYSKTENDLIPTKKGVGLNKEALRLLTNVLASEAARIDAWLDAPAPESDEGTSTLIRRRQALEELLTAPRPLASSTGSWKSPSFFAVAFDGHTDSLRLNDTHPLAATLSKAKGSPDPLVGQMVTIVESLLTSFARSRALFDGVETVTTDALFEDLEINWGLILERQLDHGAST